MHRRDTIIEIHRERVQDQTVGVFGGDKYTESVDGTGYSATATLDLTLDRVWFILDSQRRLWQEETDGESRDPLRHFAINLVIFNSKIVIDSVTCIPLLPLPPATITIPDGPRAGESREIPYNEIPLFGPWLPCKGLYVGCRKMYAFRIHGKGAFSKRVAGRKPAASNRGRRAAGPRRGHPLRRGPVAQRCVG
jgi:hypothetical protein